MPKFTIQNGSVTALISGARATLHVGDELELTPEAAAEMDSTGFYLCPSAKYVKGKTFTAKAEKPVPDDEDEDIEKPVKPAPKHTK